MKKCEQFTSEQIILSSEYELLRSGKNTYDEILELKKNEARLLFPNGFKTADEIDLEQSPISLGCKLLDGVLRGGLRRKCLTEIYGESGCGKTQISLQIAANSWNSGAVYLCTEEAFQSKRLQNFFQSFDSAQNIKNISKYGDKIFVIQLTEVDDLIKCIQDRLPRLLQIHNNISVVILDSITAPFRGNYHEANSHIERAQHLKDIGVGLLKCAKDHDVAVLCINQVSSSFSSNSKSMIPCLGLTWSNLVTTRICVSKTNRYCHINDIIEENKDASKNTNSEASMLNIRQFQVVFSPYLNNDAIVDYIITTRGVMGLNN